MRLARPLIAPTALAVLLLAGCGSSDDSTSSDEAGASRAPAGASAQSCPIDIGTIERLRVTGTNCGTGQRIATEWSHETNCSSPPEASRFGCAIHGYRCLGTTTDQGVSVSCARPRRSIAFIAKPG